MFPYILRTSKHKILFQSFSAVQLSSIAVLERRSKEEFLVPVMFLQPSMTWNHCTGHAQRRVNWQTTLSIS